jgi:uncharacterized caspase-like protein
VLTAELVDGRGVASKPVQVNVQVRAPTPGEQPALHVLAVGVSRYRDQSLTKGVAFAANDARAVASAFERGGRGLYREVRTRVLADSEATRDGILGATRAMTNAVGPQDAFVIYLAGHGVSIEGDYHYVPWETRYNNQAALKGQSLGAEAMRGMLAMIPASKVLVLLDTCSAGRFSLVEGRALDDKAALDRLQRLSGRALIAAAADEKMAIEGEGEGENRHGVFTFALLRGLEGAADQDGDGLVNITEIAGFIDAQLPEITKRKWGYEQFPVMETRGNVFPVVRRQAP